MAQPRRSGSVLYPLLAVVVFDLVIFASGLLNGYDGAWVPLVGANIVMIEVAIMCTSSPAGPNAHIFGVGMATGAAYADVVAAVACVVLMLLKAHVLISIAVFLVLAVLVWPSTAEVEHVAEQIETKQAVAVAERRVIQQLLARMNVLLGSEHDVNRRKVLGRANDALLSCPTASRPDVEPYEDAIAQSLSRLEQLEAGGAGIEALEAEVKALQNACALRNNMLKVR